MPKRLSIAIDPALCERVGCYKLGERGANMDFELKGVFPLQRSVELKVDTTDLGIALLGTNKLTIGELKAVMGCCMREWKHRGLTLEDYSKGGENDTNKAGKQADH